LIEDKGIEDESTGFSVATDTQVPVTLAALAIGAGVALGVLWGGPKSGASMNTARSFGPAHLSGAWYHHWIYRPGPIVGTAGTFVYQMIRFPILEPEPASVIIQPQAGD
jgi:glycerol uptake facilitator-like aquaporin